MLYKLCWYSVLCTDSWHLCNGTVRIQPFSCIRLTRPELASFPGLGMRLGQSPIDSIKLRVLYRVSLKVTYLVYKLSVLPNNNLNNLNKLLSIAEKKR